MQLSQLPQQRCCCCCRWDFVFFSQAKIQPQICDTTGQTSAMQFGNHADKWLQKAVLSFRWRAGRCFWAQISATQSSFCLAWMVFWGYLSSFKLYATKTSVIHNKNFHACVHLGAAVVLVGCCWCHWSPDEHNSHETTGSISNRFTHDISHHFIKVLRNFSCKTSPPSINTKKACPQDVKVRQFIT